MKREEFQRQWSQWASPQETDRRAAAKKSNEAAQAKYAADIQEQADRIAAVLSQRDDGFVVGADFAEAPEQIEVIGVDLYKRLIRDAYAKLKAYVTKHEGGEPTQEELARVADYATLNYISQAAGPTLIRIWNRLKELGVIRGRAIQPPTFIEIAPEPQWDYENERASRQPDIDPRLAGLDPRSREYQDAERSFAREQAGLEAGEKIMSSIQDAQLTCRGCPLSTVALKQLAVKVAESVPYQNISAATVRQMAHTLWVDVDVLESEKADVAAIHAFQQQETTADDVLARIGVSITNPASRTIVADQRSCATEQWQPNVEAHRQREAAIAEQKRWAKMSPAQRKQAQIDEVLRRREARQNAIGDAPNPVDNSVEEEFRREVAELSRSAASREADAAAIEQRNTEIRKRQKALKAEVWGNAGRPHG